MWWWNCFIAGHHRMNRAENINGISGPSCYSNQQFAAKVLPMLMWCRPTVYNGWPTILQHWSMATNQQVYCISKNCTKTCLLRNLKELYKNMLAEKCVGSAGPVLTNIWEGRPIMTSQVMFDTRRRANARLRLVHHLRRWPSINPLLGPCVVLAEECVGSDAPFLANIWERY